VDAIRTRIINKLPQSHISRYIVHGANSVTGFDELLISLFFHLLLKSRYPSLDLIFGVAFEFEFPTVIQNTLKIGQKYFTVPRAQERVSGASERASG